MNQGLEGRAVLGIIVFGLVSVGLIGLKMLGIVEWEWMWVLAPLWIPVAILFICVLLHLID